MNRHSSGLQCRQKGQGRPPCRVLKIPDQRKTNLSEKSALVNLLLCDFWIWFGF